MIKLINKVNVDPADGTWLYGNIRNNSGSNNGTPVNGNTMSDLFQFFERMFSQSGITATGLFDNATNGWQLFEALKYVTRMALGTIGLNASATMATYTAAYKKETLHQLLFEFTGTVAATTFTLDASTNLLDGTPARLSNTGDYEVTVSRSGSDTIGATGVTSYVLRPGESITLQLDSANQNWVFAIGGVKTLDFGTSPLGFSNSWTATIASIAIRVKNGFVELSGALQHATNFGPGGTIVTYPVGWRPKRNIVLACYFSDSAGNDGIGAIAVSTAGVFTVLKVPSGVGATTCFLNIDGLRWPLL